MPLLHGFVPGCLRLPRDAGPDRAAADRLRQPQARLHRRLSGHRVPVDAEPGFHEQTRADRRAILNPCPGLCFHDLRINRAVVLDETSPRAWAHRSQARWKYPAGHAPLASQPADLDTGIDRVAAGHRERHALTGREIRDAHVPIEWTGTRPIVVVLVPRVVRVQRECAGGGQARPRGPQQIRNGEAVVGHELLQSVAHELVGAWPGERAKHLFATHQPEHGQARPVRRMARHLDLQIGEARNVAVLEPIGDELVVGAACSRPPGCRTRSGNPAFDDDVAAGEADCARDSKPSIDTPVAGFEQRHRREPAAIACVETGCVERHAGRHRGVDEARPEVANTLRAVDLCPVEQHHVVLGAGAADGELALFIVRGRDPRQQGKHLKDVLQSSCRLEHVRGRHRMNRRRGRRLAGPLGHVHLLLDAERLLGRNFLRRRARLLRSARFSRTSGRRCGRRSRHDDPRVSRTILERETVWCEHFFRDVAR